MVMLFAEGAKAVLSESMASVIRFWKHKILEAKDSGSNKFLEVKLLAGSRSASRQLPAARLRIPRACAGILRNLHASSEFIRDPQES